MALEIRYLTNELLSDILGGEPVGGNITLFDGDVYWSIPNAKEVSPLTVRKINVYELNEIILGWALKRGYKIVTELEPYGIEFKVIGENESILSSEPYTSYASYWFPTRFEVMEFCADQIFRGFR